MIEKKRIVILKILWVINLFVIINEFFFSKKITLFETFFFV